MCWVGRVPGGGRMVGSAVVARARADGQAKGEGEPCRQSVAHTHWWQLAGARRATAEMSPLRDGSQGASSANGQRAQEGTSVGNQYPLAGTPGSSRHTLACPRRPPAAAAPARLTMVLMFLAQGVISKGKWMRPGTDRRTSRDEERCWLMPWTRLKQSMQQQQLQLTA